MRSNSREVPEPAIKPDEILIRVRAAGVNRADILQRQGFYPPPPGASEIIGMEVAGEVVALGESVKGWKVGDRAMALIPGGGYAEKAVAHYGSAMKIPATLSFEEAAGVPEVFLTVFLNFFMLAGIKRGETALIHGGGSGIGTASIQLLKEAGVRVIVTAGSDEKCDQCRKLGADVAINYKNGPFAPAVKAATDGRGVDAILDSIGGAYLAGNIESLAQGGRLVLIGLMNGTRGELDLAAVLRRHLKIIRLNAAQPLGRGESADRRGVPRAVRRRARGRQVAAADLQSGASRRRADGPSHDASERALRQNRSQVRLAGFLTYSRCGITVAP